MLFFSILHEELRACNIGEGNVPACTHLFHISAHYTVLCPASFTRYVINLINKIVLRILRIWVLESEDITQY